MTITLQEIFLEGLDQQIADEIEDKFDVKAKYWPAKKNGRTDVKTERIKKDVKTTLDITPEQTFEDNKDVGNDDEKYAAGPMSDKVLAIFNHLMPNMSDRGQMEITKRFSNYVSAENKYKYSLSDFEKAWKSLTEEEKEQFGKLINRQALDSWFGVSVY